MLVPVFGSLIVLLRCGNALGWRFQYDAVTRSGTSFRCSPPDLVQMYLWLFDVWEPDLTSLISRRLQQGDVFVDVGANIGYFTMLSSGIVGETGLVVAVEASPPVYKHLQETIARNSALNVRLVNKAASDKPGQLDVYAGPSHNIGLTTTVKSRGFSKQATVEALPLDAILSDEEIRRTRLLKIDVEGGEQAVLAGLEKLVRHGREDLEILVELSPRWWTDRARTARDVLQPLLDAGFHIYVMKNSYWPWRYLWSSKVDRPRRIRDLSVLNQRPKRLDLLLSRQDSVHI